jgi:hypothetical protein
MLVCGVLIEFASSAKHRLLDGNQSGQSMAVGHESVSSIAPACKTAVSSRWYHYASASVVLFACSAAFAKDPVELQQIPISTFLSKELRARLPDSTLDIAIPVPAGYEQTVFAKEPDSSYWMPAADVPKVKETGDLHTENGHMVAYISTSVLYDKGQDIFRGVDDPESLATAKSLFPDMQQLRYRPNDHAALVFTGTEARSGKRIYAVYIATSTVSGSVIFVAFRPPGNSSAIGDFVWDKLRGNLGSSRSYAAVGHDKSADRLTQNEMGEQSSVSANVESSGAGDPQIASAVEAAVETARSLGFNFDASKSRDGEVVVHAKWQGKEVILTMLFHRKSGAIYISSRTNQGAETFMNGGGAKIEKMFYAKLHAETDRRNLRIYADNEMF